MNALTDLSRPLPLTDDMIDEVWGDNEIPGEMLVNYTNDGINERHECCETAEIVGFHLGGNVVLTRDQIIALASRQAVESLEANYAERRGQRNA